MSVTKKKKIKEKKSQQVSNKEKKRKEKIKSKHIGDLKLNLKGIFRNSFYEFLTLSFLSIFERNFFGESREKILGLHNLFSFLSTQLNTL